MLPASLGPPNLLFTSSDTASLFPAPPENPVPIPKSALTVTDNRLVHVLMRAGCRVGSGLPFRGVLGGTIIATSRQTPGFRTGKATQRTGRVFFAGNGLVAHLFYVQMAMHTACGNWVAGF